MNTGEIEVEVDDIVILNNAEELPFSINAPEILVNFLHITFLCLYLTILQLTIYIGKWRATHEIQIFTFTKVWAST